MIGQVSDSELELMKIIWAEDGKALYAQIMDALALSLGRKGAVENKQNRPAQRIHCYRYRSRLSGDTGESLT